MLRTWTFLLTVLLSVFVSSAPALAQAPDMTVRPSRPANALNEAAVAAMDAQQEGWNRKARRALSSVCSGCTGGGSSKGVRTPLLLREDPEYTEAEPEGLDEPPVASRPKRPRRATPAPILFAGVRFTEAEWPVSFANAP